MSWSIRHIGSPAAITAQLEKEQHVPKVVKDAITSTMSGAPKGKLFDVDTSGHFDSNGGSNIYKLSVNPITLLPEPAATEAPPAAPPA